VIQTIYGSVTEIPGFAESEFTANPFLEGMHDRQFAVNFGLHVHAFLQVRPDGVQIEACLEKHM
jgi:hypothetical protein